MNPALKSKPQAWSLSQIIDFEQRIEADQHLDESTLEQRDQAIAQKISPSPSSPSPQSSSHLLQIWLSHLKPDPSIPSLGHEIIASAKLGSRILYLLYALFGLGLGFQLLSYSGSEPINVSAFFGLVILLQILFVLLSIVLTLSGLPNPKALEYSPGVRLARFAFWSLNALVTRLSSFSLDAAKRQALLAFIGRLRGRLWLYRDPIRWVSCGIASKGGIAFNLGICLAIVTSVTFSDRAFGWQTSLNISAASIHNLVTILATPWSWLIAEGRGYPSLSQIEGSQIILKDGIRSLQTTDLTSWWPFLLLATVTYELLPRIVLGTIAARATTSSLRNIDFSDAASKRVVGRLSPTASPFSYPQYDPHASPASTAPKNAIPHPPSALSKETVVWVASSLWNNPTLTEQLPARLGTDNLRELSNPIVADPQSLAAKLPNQATPLAFVFESWLPPLEETKQLLKSVRTLVLPNTAINVYLHPGNSDLQPDDLKAWSNALQQLGDPYLNLEPLSK